jgi:hypothetical protein
VISLMSLLVALIVPAIGAARERSRDIQCQNGLRQCLLTMHQIASDTGKLPEGVSRPWTRTVLKQLDATLRDDETKLTSSGREMFVCPAAPKSLAVAEEVSNRGMNAETADKPLESISDGTSHTILIGELSSLTSIAWYEGPGIFPAAMGAFHREKSNLGLCDGSVRGISDSVDESVLQSLLTPSGGELPMEY